MNPSRSRFVDLRRLRYHVREWGDASAPQLWMLHGWMDVSASFQFVVDALKRDWHVLAPDWRGFGQTSWASEASADCYWYPDYLADLEFLLDALTDGKPITLLGHSMGGNIAMTYAGVRPARIAALINLEGFGLKNTVPAMAPGRYARWIDELKAGGSLHDYASLSDVAARLQKNNPRLSGERALFLAAHWSQLRSDGRYQIAGDPAHRIINPVLHRWEELAACWERITCPVLWVQADDTDAQAWAGDQAQIDQRRAIVPNARTVRIAQAGHMVHHDQPEQIARLIEDFVPAS